MPEQAAAAGLTASPPSRRSGKRPQKKICIYGTTPSRSLGPWNDPSWDHWTIGPGGSDEPRMPWNRIFELHGPTTWPRAFRHHVHELEKSCNAIPTEFMAHIKALKVLTESNSHALPIAFDGYLDLLKGTKKPKVVYTQKPLEGCEANVVLDLEKLHERYGRVWFTSQISYALALAIDEKATDIGIFGIDLESGEEYRSQFLGARHFIDLARRMGINIVLPQGCGLLRDPHPYPTSYETNLALTSQFKMRHLNAIRDQAKAEYESTLRDIHMREGALLALRGFRPTPEGVQPEIDRIAGEVAELQKRLGNLGAQLARIEGEASAFTFINERYVIHGDDPNHLAA